MALNAELKTKITADDREFVEATLKAKRQVRDLAQAIRRDYGTSLKEAESIAKRTLSNTQTQIKKTTSLFREMLKGFAAAFSAGAIISIFKDTYKSIDDIITVSEKLDVPVQSFQALSYAAVQADTEISTLENGLKKLRNTLALAMAGNKNAIKAFKDLNLNIGELSTMKIDDVYVKISDAIKKVGNSTKQAGLAGGIFGKREGQEQLNFLRSNIRGFVDEAKSAGNVFTDDQIRKFKQVDEQFNRISTTIKSDLQKAIIELTPHIMTLASAFAATARFGSSFVSEWSRGISEGATEIRNLITGTYSPKTDTKTSVEQNLVAQEAFRLATGAKQLSRRDLAARALSQNTAGSAAGNLAPGSVLNVGDELIKLAFSTKAASEALETLGKGTLKALFGVEGGNGKSYLSQILTKRPQAMDETFTKLANDLRDIVQTGGNVRGVQFQSSLKLMEQIARDAGLDPNKTNSGMLAAVNEIKKAAGLIQTKQEVEISIVADSEGMIKAFANSPSGKKIMVGYIQESAAREASATAL